MSMKSVGQLNERELGWAMAQVMDVPLKDESLESENGHPWSPTTMWQQSGPVLDALKGELFKRDPTKPLGQVVGEGDRICKVKGIFAAGHSNRVAICRVAILEKYGASVELPDWL